MATKVDFDGLKKSKSIGNVRGWKPEAGKNKIRVLPPGSQYIDKELGGKGEAMSRLDVPFRSHFVRLDGRDVEVFRCLRDVDDQKCPACEFFFQHKDSKDEAVKKMAKHLNNSFRFLLNIVDMKEPEKGVQPYETGSTVRNSILTTVSEGDYGTCVDPGEDGRDFLVHLTMGSETASGYNSYEVNPGPKQYSILDELPEGWVEQLDALENQTAEVKTVEQIQDIVDQASIQVGVTPSGTSSAPPARETKSITPPETQKVTPPAASSPGPDEDKKTEPESKDAPEPENEKKPEPEKKPKEDSGGDDDAEIQSKLDELFG